MVINKINMKQLNIIKYAVIYLTLSIVLMACKTDNKKTNKTVTQTIQTDTVKTKKTTKEIDYLKAKLIGKTYRGLSDMPEFNDYSIGWFVIGNEDDFKNSYDISVIRGEHDLIKYLMLSELVRRTNEGKSISKIIDIIDVTEIVKELNKKHPKEDISIFEQMLINNKRDPELFGFAPFKEEEIITEVYKVWRANHKTGKIEDVKNISNIVIVNDDW